MKVILLQDVKSVGKKGDMVELSEGYARNFILPKKLGVEATNANLNNLKLQKANEEKIAKEHLSVRDTEKLVKNINQPVKKAPKKELKNDFVYKDMEEQLKQKIGTKVKINRKSENKGKIEIEYYSQDDLEKIVAYFK